MAGPYSNQFRLSITEALSTQLFAALDRLEPAPLTSENLDALYPLAEKLGLASLSGVYQLFRQKPGEERVLTYVGKADQPLPKRLGDHLKKLSGRAGISVSEMSFRCLFVEEDLSSVSPEKMLIKRHLETGTIVWNNRGFGPNDPGSERDTTRNSENHWDLEFPIDLARKVQGLVPGQQPLKVLLKAIKQGLPFNFRFAQGLGPLGEKVVTVTDTEMTAEEAFQFVGAHLTGKWQVSALVGWVIMYEDDHKVYPSAFRYYRPDGVIVDQKPITRKPKKGENPDEVGEGEN